MKSTRMSNHHQNDHTAAGKERPIRKGTYETERYVTYCEKCLGGRESTSRRLHVRTRTHRHNRVQERNGDEDAVGGEIRRVGVVNALAECIHILQERSRTFLARRDEARRAMIPLLLLQMKDRFLLHVAPLKLNGDVD